MLNLLPLISFITVMAITPGPNTIMLWLSGTNFGLKRTIPHIAGITLGFGILMLLCGFGLGVLFEQYPLMRLILKVVGSSYLIYLAYRMFSASLQAKDAESKPLSWLEAATFQFANPKGWVMALTAMSSFTLHTNTWLNVLAITIIFMVMSCLCISVWAVFGSILGRVLSNPRYLKVFNIIMVSLLLLTVVLIWR